MVGGTINAAAAAAITTAFGEMYIATLDFLFAKHAGESPSEEEVLEGVQRRVKEGSLAKSYS